MSKLRKIQKREGEYNKSKGGGHKRWGCQTTRPSSNASALIQAASCHDELALPCRRALKGKKVPIKFAEQLQDSRCGPSAGIPVEAAALSDIRTGASLTLKAHSLVMAAAALPCSWCGSSTRSFVPVGVELQRAHLWRSLVGLVVMQVHFLRHLRCPRSLSLASRRTGFIVGLSSVGKGPDQRNRGFLDIQSVARQLCLRRVLHSTPKMGSSGSWVPLNDR